MRAAAEGTGVPFEVVPCDPALADTAAFCEAYGYEMEDSANCVVVIGKADPPVFAACVVLATTRLDVNGVVRRRLGTRKASFAPADDVVAATGMAIGGVTPLALPEGLAAVGRRAGDGARAHRARRRQPSRQGARPAGDPHRAGRRGRRRPRQAGGRDAGSVDDGELHVDVAPGRVGVGAHLVGALDEGRRRRRGRGSAARCRAPP